MYFFWERSSFIFHQQKNISYFREKRNIIFPDDIWKIIFQCNFFRQIIFSEHLEKEIMVFHAVIHEIDIVSIIDKYDRFYM